MSKSRLCDLGAPSNLLKPCAPKTGDLPCACVLGLWRRPIPPQSPEPLSLRFLVLRQRSLFLAWERTGVVGSWNLSMDTANQGSSAVALRGGKLIPNLSNPNQFLTWPRLWG